MNSDEIESLEWRRKHFDEWLARHKEAQRIVPFVRSNLEVTEWAIEALSNRPAEAEQVADPGFAEQFNEENEYIRQVVPMMPLYDADVAIGSTAVTSISSSDVFVHVAEIGGLGTPATIEYSDVYTARYIELQESQERQSRARGLVSRLGNPKTLERFDRAVTAHASWRAGTVGRTTVANEMRNLVDGIKGDLFQAASKWPRENMTWQRMAERLARGGPESLDAHQLSHLEAKHSRLIDLLSGTLKDREGRASVDLEHVWTQILDHLYSLLTLANLSTDGNRKET